MSETFDPNKVYLIDLSGMGDRHSKLVNHETFAWVINGGDAPKAQIEAIWQGNQKFQPEETIEDVAEEMRSMTDGSSPDNDRAIVAVPDPFGPEGKTFQSYDGSVRELMAFLAENNLEIGEEYEGYLY